MRYFALLYTPTERRGLMTALFVIDAEIRASVNTAHEVAHTRLQWWRGEIDRLINRNAQHPATRVVQTALPDGDFAILHELLVAADMDLARMTYNNDNELAAYLERSGGAIFELANERPRQSTRRAGAFVRRVETLRDLTMDVRAGRIYWPLEKLESHNLAVEQLHDTRPSAASRALVAAEISRLRTELAALRTSLRPLAVLIQLHAKLLDRIERAHYDVFSQRHELSPLEKVFTAWRAARRS